MLAWKKAHGALPSDRAPQASAQTIRYQSACSSPSGRPCADWVATWSGSGQSHQMVSAPYAAAIATSSGSVGGGSVRFAVA